MGKGRWLALGAGAVLGTALLVAASSLALQRQTRDWAPEARAAAQKAILDRESDEGDVQFADVKVRETGIEDEKSVCGTSSVRRDDGSQGPFRDFWIVVTKAPGTPAGIQAVRMETIGFDDFLDRSSAYFRSCFADDP